MIHRNIIWFPGLWEQLNNLVFTPVLSGCGLGVHSTQPISPSVHQIRYPFSAIIAKISVTGFSGSPKHAPIDGIRSLRVPIFGRYRPFSGANVELGHIPGGDLKEGLFWGSGFLRWLRTVTAYRDHLRGPAFTPRPISDGDPRQGMPPNPRQQDKFPEKQAE